MYAFDKGFWTNDYNIPVFDVRSAPVGEDDFLDLLPVASV